MSRVAQILTQIDIEANSCAADRKSGISGFFTRKGSYYDQCKNDLVNGKYKDQLAQAYADENYIGDQLNAAYETQLGGGLSKQSLMIIAGAFVALITVAIIFKHKR